MWPVTALGPRALRRRDDRRRRERTRWPVLRRAPRQAVALLHRARVLDGAPLGGTFGTYIATSPEKEGVAREGLLAEFAKLREEPVTGEELDRAQTYAIGVHAIRQQSGGAVLGEMVEAWMFGTLGELDEYESQVRAVTAMRILETARAYFDPGRRVEGIVRGIGKTV